MEAVATRFAGPGVITVPTTSVDLNTAVTLSALTFTPAVSGTALLFGRVSAIRSGPPGRS